MTIAVVIRDLLLFSRIEGAASAAGASLTRVDTPDDLPRAEGVDLVLVDWTVREPSWSDQLRAWRSGAPSDRPRIITFGPHTDLQAHADARDAGLGPMWARSRLISRLPALVRGE